MGKPVYTDAELVALEASNQLLAPLDLVGRATKDLTAIRSADPSLDKVKHQSPWAPGELIVSGLAKDSLEALNRSEYGPVETEAIFQDEIFVVTFAKPYHPVRLAERLEKELEIKNCEPNGTIGMSSRITLKGDATGTNEYVFFIGSGDCPSGCINKRYVTYSVSPSGIATLISDVGSA